MKNLKKYLFLILFFLPAVIFGLPLDSIQEFTLDNGLTVFLLPDNSSALLRVEVSVQAGFSSQTQETSGFFKLYSNIIKTTQNKFNFEDVQCNADSTRFIFTVTPSQLPDLLDDFSQKLFSPAFSDEIILTQLNLLKKEVQTNSQDLSFYINSSIDSRVFSDAPWKHDSGIYPSLFAKTSPAKARNILETISNGWYTPQNTVLFISGNLDINKTLELIEDTFGHFYSSSGIPQEQITLPRNKQKKFVIHHKELSPDLTQVVIQFTQLDMEECQLLSAMFNNPSSTLKQLLLSQLELNIPGDEYINIAAANKRNSSRLIIQALLQKPENKNIKITSQEQTDLFVQSVIKAFEMTTEQEFNFYKQEAITSVYQLFQDSSIYMDNLSQFWAIQKYSPVREDNLDAAETSITAAKMLNFQQKISEKDFHSIKKHLNAENPFIFSIIDSNRFTAEKKNYTNAGYQEINSKNSSWYLQKLFSNIEKESSLQQQSQTSIADYYLENSASIKQITLQNGIPLITKYNPMTSLASILIKIQGGKLNTAKNHGFEEVMINLLASNIRNEIFKKQYNGIITGTPQISTQIDLTSSAILIECHKDDMSACMKALSDALIYGELIPSMADRTVSNRQYKKRMENGSTMNQMLSAIIKQLYGKSNLYSVFETEKDVLEKTKFEEFMAAYPDFLDATRYAVIVTGNFSPDVTEIMDETIGVLSGLKTNLTTIDKSPEFPVSKNLKVKINHTFLTDIPAEKAGPMPAVLIPTTEFLDPVMYVIQAPDTKDDTSKVHFNALMLYLKECLQNQVNQNSRIAGSNVTVRLSDETTPFAVIIFSDVKHTKECDSEYKTTLKKIMNDLTSSGESFQTVEKIKNLWITEQMGQTLSNSGTALLIYNSLNHSQNLNPKQYLDDYNTIQNSAAEMYIKLLLDIPTTPVLRAYSTDSKN